MSLRKATTAMFENYDINKHPSARNEKPTVRRKIMGALTSSISNVANTSISPIVIRKSSAGKSFICFVSTDSSNLHKDAALVGRVPPVKKINHPGYHSAKRLCESMIVSLLNSFLPLLGRLMAECTTSQKQVSR